MKKVLFAIMLTGLLAFGCTQAQKIEDKDALLKAFNDPATPLSCTFTANETVTQLWKNGANIATSMKGANAVEGQGESFELKGVYKNGEGYIESKGLLAFMAALVNAFGGSVDAKKDVGCDWVKTTPKDADTTKVGQMTEEDLTKMLETGATWECSTGGFGDEVFATPGTTCTDAEFKEKAGLNTPSGTE